jgi:hypothetical protein
MTGNTARTRRDIVDTAVLEARSEAMKPAARRDPIAARRVRLNHSPILTDTATTMATATMPKKKNMMRMRFLKASKSESRLLYQEVFRYRSSLNMELSVGRDL